VTVFSTIIQYKDKKNAFPVHISVPLVIMEKLVLHAKEMIEILLPYLNVSVMMDLLMKMLKTVNPVPLCVMDALKNMIIVRYVLGLALLETEILLFVLAR
jgi:hypothetical protein